MRSITLLTLSPGSPNPDPRTTSNDPQCATSKHRLNPRCLSKPRIKDSVPASRYSSKSMRLSKTPIPSPDFLLKAEQPHDIDGRLWCSEEFVRLEHPDWPAQSADWYLCSREVKCWRKKVVRQRPEIDRRIWMACREKCGCR